MSFCLNMLQIWIFVAKFSYMDPAVFQPFCCVFNVALCGRANTAAYNQVQHFFEANILNLK